MPTETKIKYYLRQRMFSSIPACSLEDLTNLRYFSEIPSWDLICRDYRLQKKCRNSYDITTSFRFHSKVRSTLVWATNTCTIIDHDPLDQLNSNSCFPHRDMSGNLFPANSVSFRSRSSNHIPVKLTTAWSIPRLKIPEETLNDEIWLYRLPSNHSHSRQTEFRFKFHTSQNPLEPYFGEIPVYRLPSNHCSPRETDTGFEFPTSQNPPGTPFQWNPGVSAA